jgi:branched-chain amino acid transport system permease protein
MTAVSLSPFVPLPLAILGAVVVTTILGGLIQIVFIRPAREASTMRLIVITIGISIVLREAMLHIWDEKVRALRYFTGNECSSVNVLGAAISPQVLWVLGTVAVAVAILHAFLKYTLAGRAMRACSSNPEAAMLAGINIRNMRTLAFGMSAALGALAGCVVSPISMTQYDMGSGLAIKGFAAAVLGGLGHPLGGVVGGLLVGLVEAYSVMSGLPAAYKDAAAFAILLIVLFLKPHGLFGMRGGESVREC